MTGKHEEAIYFYLESTKELISYNETKEAYALISGMLDVLKKKSELADEVLKGNSRTLLLIMKYEMKFEWIGNLLSLYSILPAG